MLHRYIDHLKRSGAAWGVTAILSCAPYSPSYTPSYTAPSGHLVTIRSSPAGAEVTVDGRYIGKTPIPVRVVPGERYSILVEKAGLDSQRFTLDDSAPNDYQVALSGTIDSSYSQASVPDTGWQQIEAERRRIAAEDRARREAERQRVAAEQQRLVEDQQRAEQQAQVEAERRRIAADRQKLEEESRQLAEVRAKQELDAQRLAEERRQFEESGRAKDEAAGDQRGVQVDGRLPADFVLGQYSRAWAVVIGINRYRNNVPKLRYAVADAKAVGNALEAQGFSVIRLFDEDATRNRILEVLGDELPEKVKPGDRVAIFYAGHGETKNIEGAKEMGYLLPVDATREQLHRSSINMGEIRLLADALPAKHVLFMVDVCYGGIAGTQFRSLPAQTAAYLQQITKERGRQLITAGGAGQQVVEGPQWGHSVFTYYLLEGLKGLADLNQDGVIPTTELYAYLDGRVPFAAENQQRPELWSLAAEKGEFVFIPSRSSIGKAGASSGIEPKR